ncbi:MAG TPA: NAD(P)-dependent oxidoreductase [Pseudonocardiaceae bacterium]|jgi:3-hydroxyisobutyrate dehydrogenase
MRELNVSVIGLGGMGGGMARALLAAGFHITVYNRTIAKAESLRAQGATVAASAGEAAEGADVVLFSLADEAAVEQVLFGEVIWKMRPGTTVLDTSTVSPAFARNTALRLAASGIHRVEACVVGNPMMANTGQLRVFTAGEPEAAESMRPVLGALSQEIRHLGPAGRASALKLAFNLLLGIQTAGLAEAVAFAEGAGVDRDLLLTALDNSGWRSPVLSFRSEFMRKRAYEPAGFRATLMHKDLQLADEEARSFSVDLPLVEAAAQRFAEAIDAGRGDEDAAVVVELTSSRSPAVQS